MIDFSIDDNEAKALRKAFKRAPDMAFKELKRGFVRISAGFLTQHTRDNLRGRPGIIIRSGQAGLAGSTFTDVEGGSIDRLEVNTFVGGSAQKYAEIQEFGTVGAGGTMKDIVPKRAKVLAFEVDGQTIFAKRVKVPPRFGWIKTWDAREDKREEQYRKTLKKIVEGMAK